MDFKAVVIKNFKGSFNKYLAYFLSGSFSIMLFFMYSVLILNKEMRGRDDMEVLSYIFPITMVAIALFSIFFINYAHSAFMKGRSKEFGVYISLGVNNRELRNLINIESMLISAASLLSGIGMGLLFSRLFQMVILSLLEIKDIPYYMDYKPFLLTVSVFLFIFATVMAGTFLRMRRMDIQGLLKEARKSESREYSKRDPVLGGLGLIIMALSIPLLVIIAGNDDWNTNPIILILYMVTAFFGVYLTLACGGNLVLHIIKKSRFYHKNMLAVTELHHKFNQNKRIIFVLSVLSTMTIFLVASPFSLFNLSEKIAEMDKNHLEYVETASLNKLSAEELNEIVKGSNLKSNISLKFIYLSMTEGSGALKDCKPVVAQSEYNSLTGGTLELAKGEAYNVVLDWVPGNHGIIPGSTYQLYAGGLTYRFRFVASERRGNWITGMNSFPANSVIVISDADYNRLSPELTESNIGYYHLINFKSWKQSKAVIAALKAALGDSELKAASILDTYEGLKSGYSVFLFVSTVMGIMFFVAGGSVLYFKQFTELAEAKVTFRKLYKIGITDKEMSKIVGKELLTVFFLPLVFGAFLGCSLIYLMTFVVGGGAIIKEFMTNAFLGVLIYFVSQGIFYLITKNKYVSEIVKG